MFVSTTNNLYMSDALSKIIMNKLYIIIKKQVF